MSPSLVVLLLAGAVSTPAEPTEPLHAGIDRLVEARPEASRRAGPASDLAFLRRVTLDLAGRIPTVEESTRFVAEDSKRKRDDVIERLLKSPDYPRRMQELFHVMLMERRGTHDEWQRFLRHAFEQNMPWDQLVRAMLAPDATDEQLRGGAYFLTARLTKEGAMAPVDVPGLTRDVGRLIAGVDFGCAQCHDHVSIEDYKQVDFQGLHVIFENMQSRGGAVPTVTERILKAEREFQSVFTQEPRSTPLRIPGAGDVAITTFPRGEEYMIKPDPKTKTPGVLKFSPLRELASRLASGENRLFAQNIANRLWFSMMGRGLVEPLDLFHSGNPPSHPELLDLMAEALVRHDFDIKWFLGQIARTRCYQRSSIWPHEQPIPPPRSFAVGNQKGLSAEQLFWSVLVATGELDRARKSTGDQSASRPQTKRGDATVSATVLTEPERLVAGSDSLDDLQKQFLKIFSNPPREPEVDFAPTVKGALYLMHDEAVLGLLAPRAGNLVMRLSREPDDKKLAAALFLAIVNRKPTSDDLATVSSVLKDKTGLERERLIGQLAWALLASAEFCVNH